MLKKMIASVAAVLMAVFAAAGQEPQALLRFDPATAHDLRVKDLGGGRWEVVTTGGDPFVHFLPLTRAVDDDACVLTFEYTASQMVNAMQLYFSPISGNRSMNIPTLDGTVDRKTRTYAVNLREVAGRYGWGAAGDVLRIDFGMQSGAKLVLEKVGLRAMTAGEKAAHEAAMAAEARKKVLAGGLESYLQETYPCRMKKVSVGADAVRVRGRLRGKGPFFLVEVAPWQDVVPGSFEGETIPLHRPWCFAKKVARKAVLPDGATYDRILSRWMIVRRDADGTLVPVSHARYADVAAPVHSAPKMALTGKKGMGGFRINRFSSDLDSLDIRSVTVNIHLNSLVFKEERPHDIPYEYGGVTWHFDADRVAGLDETFRYCTERGIITSAITLIDLRSADPALTPLFRHPDCNGGFYSMPNMTEPAAVNAYAAVLDFLASRYSGGEHGRINHWIIHNEVDYGADWTNMGVQPYEVYMDAYMKSMRMTWNIARQYDQNAWVLGSYTHNWTAGENGFKPKEMLERNLRYSAAEGDFPWGVACHPYPQDLTAPRFWAEDDASTFSMDTKYVTFSNLEVVDRWIRDPEHFYKRGKRLLFLSENGTNSPSYSEEDLRDQAAGACWAWKKVEALEGIDAIQWHAWIDDRGEFGLRIGMRRYPNDETFPGGEKPVWYVWKAAGTDREDEVFAPYLEVMGLKDWNEIFHDVD